MIVVDTSALIEIARQTEIGMALQWFIQTDEALISCELLRAELGSVCRKIMRIENTRLDQALEYYRRSISLVDEFYPMDDLAEEALRESIRLDHSTYDLFYFVLARRMGATLFTLDRTLMRLCERNGVQCVSEVEL